MTTLTPTVKMRRLSDEELGGKGRSGLPLPAYESDGAAGYDLAAALAEDEVVTVEPGKVALIHSGFAMYIPDGYEGQIRPRSGLSLKHMVVPINSPGTIDSDYRGSVAIAICNLGSTDFKITRGMRIAQMIIAPVAHAIIEETLDDAPQTKRGAGGFGSTGT